jgi:hypothetical protein
MMKMTMEIFVPETKAPPQSEGIHKDDHRVVHLSSPTVAPIPTRRSIAILAIVSVCRSPCDSWWGEGDSLSGNKQCWNSIGQDSFGRLPLWVGRSVWDMAHPHDVLIPPNSLQLFRKMKG